VAARDCFEAKLVWRAWGRCTWAYIGVWEESGRIKIQIRDKIRVLLKNKILQKSEIRVGFR
jgi:hypothetical protein